MAQYYTSFYPLCCTSLGVKSAIKHDLPPYVDGSCRREPDFENETPAITGLCRPGFSKKLKVGDKIVYVTNKKLLGQRKIIAVLEVIEKVKSHKEAAEYYKERKKEIPNNIIVKETKPIDLDKTHQMGRWDTWFKGTKELEGWDKLYKERAEEYPEVAICKIWNEIINIYNPLSITDNDLKAIFKRIPGTRNPPIFKDDEWENFLRWSNSNIRFLM